MNTCTVIVAKLECPESWGDWHDRPLRWIVTTSINEIGMETQKFQTKKDALLYARIRRNSSTDAVAMRTYSIRTL